MSTGFLNYGRAASKWQGPLTLVDYPLLALLHLPDLDKMLDEWMGFKVDYVPFSISCLTTVLLFQLSIKQELKLSESAVQIKKDKKAVKDLMVCPKKKKRKQRSPAKVQVRILPQEI